MGNIQLINAGAGSGKTYTLTKEFCDLLLKGAKPSQFILTTYTKAAADEFVSKIKARLMSENMADMIPLVESAHIGTIHSVAKTFVEKYWYLLDMSPNLSLKDEVEMGAFKERVLDIVATDQDQAFFDDYSFQMGVNDNGFWKSQVLAIVDMLGSYGLPLTALDQFKKSSVEIVEEVYKDRKVDMSKLKALVDDADGYLSGVRGNPASILREEVAKFGDNPSLNASIPIFKAIAADKPSKWVQGIPEDFQDFVTCYVHSQARKKASECVERIFELAKRLHGQIEFSKKAEGVLEFSDLEVLFLQLLSNASVANDIASSVKYVFVDEFQDVSPIQLRIFETLANIVGENCWVGDPKQAIYGFRGSDSALANSVIAHQANKRKLEYSFRSLPKLVDEANEIFVKAFGCLCPSEAIKEDLVKLKVCDKKMKEEALYGGSYKGVQHWWLSVPKNDGSQSVDKKNAAALYPAVASKLKGIFKEKSYKVTDTDSADKPFLRDLDYGDVAILTKSNEDCQKIASALREKGLPVSVLDGKLDNQVEVKLVLSLMKYIAGVDENLAEAELRRLLRDEQLEQIFMGLAKKEKCSELAQLLGVLQARYQYYSVYDMARALVAALDLRHMVCKWSMDQKRQANLDVLIGMAASFVGRGTEASVAEFIRYIGAAKVNVPFDNTGNTIKVLTYHKSKGLQWKMVILNSLHYDSLAEGDFVKKTLQNVNVIQNASGGSEFRYFPPVGSLAKLVASEIPSAAQGGSLWKTLREKRVAEDLRLLYVGFTRAENYLVRLSFGACPSLWLDNTNVVFDPNMQREEINDDYSVAQTVADSVKVLPYDNMYFEKDVEDKFISPSKCPGFYDGVTCDAVRIADNVDVSRYGVKTDVFGTCVHKYMAIHRWEPGNLEVSDRNVANAARVIENFGLSSYLAAETVVGQADILYRYLADAYGEFDCIMHEIPFTHRRAGKVVEGEIDLYIKTKNGKGLLLDFKNPLVGADVKEEELASKALRYWPQMEAYRDALVKSGNPVNQISIYYPMLGMLAKF